MKLLIPTPTPTSPPWIQEQQDDAFPSIAGELPDVARYTTVLLGSPVRNVRAPRIMFTFIEGVDLTGKIVYPFVTYAVSGIGNVEQVLQASQRQRRRGGADGFGGDPQAVQVRREVVQELHARAADLFTARAVIVWGNAREWLQR
nr:flavodoxin [Micromonospora sp. CB01531]